MPQIFFIGLLSTVAALTGARALAADFPAPVERLVANAKSKTRLIDLAEFKRRYDKNAAGLVLDVRDPDEYAAGHIPGAVNVSRGRLEFAVWKYVGGAARPDYRRKITLYCASSLRTVLAAQTLARLGFTDVTAVEMNFSDWEAAGYPVE